jgi:hypothetical protein
MSHYLFKQLEIIRKTTLSAIEDVTEEMADMVHKGFRNNIRWHVGHIYVVQEKFAFANFDLPMELTPELTNFFGPGTTPLDWNTLTPTLSELTLLLQHQQSRIQNALENRLHEKANHPFTTKSGLTLETVEEFLSFSLYHEGVHVSAIKCFKTLASIK